MADGETKKRLALSIINFLNTSVEDGTLPSDDRESIEVAINCIAESFKVDPSEASGAIPSLLSIFTSSKAQSTSSTKSSSSTAGASSSASSAPAASATSKNAEAETLKGRGNVAMQEKNYDEAVRLYTEAINLQPTNPIYLSNRAAAYSAMKQHDLAKQDAEIAVASDPKYTKAWSRLGLAKYALGDPKGSMEAYKSGIDAEGSGGSEAMRKGYETAKKRVEELGLDENDDDVEEDERDAGSAPGAGGAGGMPDLSALAGMFGGGGGGMPDIGSLMQNPMMRQMAQNLMSNPDMMSNLMNNPRLRDMANQFGGGGGGGAPGGNAGGSGRGGGGMPDIASLMQDPSIAEMARNFMGGMGGGGAGGGAGRGGGRGSS